MSKPIIEVAGVGKCYQLGQQNASHLREKISSVFSNVGRQKLEAKEFWALKDVSFDIQAGDAVGIVGRNGAGKSTLLKILSRITAPTTGSITMRGRVGCLLEVGTGFHPELTGRENIYLNGAILGMNRREVTSKFDQIVAFSEVEKFLDTPVKRYSSGMYVRLAFAVAAHLDPEILIVDEVLAVGDAEFQRKCLGKMGEVAQGGRTVLFVSHNLSAVAQLCTKGVLLERGQVKLFADSSEIVNAYLSTGEDRPGEAYSNSWQHLREGDGPMRVNRLAVKTEAGDVATSFCGGDSITIEADLTSEVPKDAIVSFTVRDRMGSRVIHITSTDERFPVRVDKEPVKVSAKFTNILNDGKYTVSVWLGDSHAMSDRITEALSFDVDSSILGQSNCTGIVRIPAVWETKVSTRA